jgi:hypothetical protein
VNRVPSLSNPGIIILSLALWCGAPAALADCQSDPSWFPHSQTPEPGTTGFNSNCAFHQWSWQAFLWLTKEVNGKPLFLSFSSPNSLIEDVPYRGMMPRMQKSNTPESFNEFLQAGTDGIMVDQQGRAIYYSQHIDSNFVKFILSNKLTDPAVVRQFNPTTNFPDGTMELKVSWKIVQPGDDVSDMFTMDGEINKLVNKDGKIVVDPNQRDKVKLALVGFHIAGVVENHPEMIWATFEHKRNAPVVPANATPTTVVSDKDWTFYKANTQYKDCNVNYANTNKLNLDEATQILSPSTQACRQFEFGNDPNSTDPNVQQNDANIASLNADVLKHLDENDVWRNYFEVGAIWFAANNGLKPNMSLATDEILTGSVKLSNATIETYTQTQSTMNNCFRCHNTMQAFPGNPDLAPLPALNINISHAFQNIYFWSQDTTDAQ